MALVGRSLVRPTWSEYFMSIAKVVATRSDCERDQVGAVVVKDNRIRATGYNGAPAGNPGCESCPRRVGGAPPGSDYESGAGLCHAIHAEANALLYCNREDLPGATLYVSRAPCTGCSKLIAAVGITDVVYPGSVPKNPWTYNTIAVRREPYAWELHAPDPAKTGTFSYPEYFGSPTPVERAEALVKAINDGLIEKGLV